MAVIKTSPNATGTSGKANRPVELAKPAASSAPARTGGVARPIAGRTPVPASKRGAFLSDTQLELRRVVWPTREEVRSGTIVTVLLLLVFGAYIFGIDTLIARTFEALNLYPDAPVAR